MHTETPFGLSRRGLLRLLPTAAACSTFPAIAQKPEALALDLGRIGKALATMVDSGRAAGVSALVWKDGREAYFGAAGFADREAGRKMARDTIVQIYSMTKPVTGVTLMKLWEQGK